MSTQLQHLNIKIFGKVQGVFFRDSAVEKAGELNIFGFAKNEPSGTVYIEAEGERTDLEKFLDWCYKGPPGAIVEKVEFEADPKIRHFAEFSLK